MEGREQVGCTCVRLLADGPVGAGHRSSSRDRRQLVRHWTDPSVRDHLPARGPRLHDGDRRVGAGGGHGHGGGGHAPCGCAARSFPCEADPDHRQSRERTGLRRSRIRRASLARLRLLRRRRRRFRSRGKREPTSESDPGHAGAARRLDCAPPSRRQFRKYARACFTERRWSRTTCGRRPFRARRC